MMGGVGKMGNAVFRGGEWGAIDWDFRLALATD